jgi:hypothetical protein
VWLTMDARRDHNYGLASRRAGQRHEECYEMKILSDPCRRGMNLERTIMHREPGPRVADHGCKENKTNPAH